MPEKSVSLRKPVRKTGITTKDIGGETMLYSVDAKAIHVLNPTARLIWELCDGEHTLGEIERAVRAGFSVPEEHDVAGDIQHTLELLASKGLLEQTDGKPSV